jgi:hypothetical protein
VGAYFLVGLEWQLTRGEERGFGRADLDAFFTHMTTENLFAVNSIKLKYASNIPGTCNNTDFSTCFQT